MIVDLRYYKFYLTQRLSKHNYPLDRIMNYKQWLEYVNNHGFLKTEFGLEELDTKK